MKMTFKVFALALIPALAMGFASCGEQGEGGARLSLSPVSLDFTGLESEKYVNVTGEDWTASVNQPWVHIDPATGSNGTITVSVDANDTVATRYATLTVSNADGSKTVSIQQGFLGEIVLDNATLSFFCAGETKTVNVQSEIDWSVVSNQTWLKVTKTDDTTITAIADPNSGDSRTATITVTNNAGFKTIAVTQEENLGLQLTDVLEGKYFLDFYGYSLGNYAFKIQGLDASGNGYQIWLDFLSDLVFARGTVPLPVGAYQYGDTYDKYTISKDMVLIYTNGTLTGAAKVSGGTMDVTAEGSERLLKFNITLGDANSTQIKAYYRGPVEIVVQEALIESTLFEDMNIGNINVSVIDTYYPDAFENGSADAYVFWLMSDGVYIDNNTIKGNGWYINTQISAPLGSGATLPNGTYIIADNSSAGYALGGYDNGGPAGTWIRELTSDALSVAAPIKTGTITTTYSGGTYKFVLDGGDDAGNSITATFTGSPVPASLGLNPLDQKLATAKDMTSDFTKTPAEIF